MFPPHCLSKKTQKWRNGTKIYPVSRWCNSVQVFKDKHIQIIKTNWAQERTDLCNIIANTQQPNSVSSFQVCGETNTGISRIGLRQEIQEGLFWNALVQVWPWRKAIYDPKDDAEMGISVRCPVCLSFLCYFHIFFWLPTPMA